MKRKQNSAKPLSREDVKYIESLLKENENVINTTIYNTLGHTYRAISEDAIGELCLLMCEKIETLKTHECPKAWLIVSAKFVALGLTRKQNKQTNTLSLDNIIVGTKGTEVFDEVQYAMWLENKAPEKLIATLSKRESEVYRKIYIESKTVKEIAKELDVTENTVRNVHKNLRDKIINAIKRNNF